MHCVYVADCAPLFMLLCSCLPRLGQMNQVPWSQVGLADGHLTSVNAGANVEGMKTGTGCNLDRQSSARLQPAVSVVSSQRHDCQLLLCTLTAAELHKKVYHRQMADVFGFERVLNSPRSSSQLKREQRPPHTPIEHFLTLSPPLQSLTAFQHSLLHD